MVLDDRPTIDPNTPSVARVYDFYLGGENYYPSDTALADHLDGIVPGIRGLAINNRRYLIRVASTLARDYGIRQFIDNGTGLPTQNNVHQVVQRIAPDSRVVYVEKDPVVLAHNREHELTPKDGSAAFVQADIRDVETIFSDAATRRLINLDEPVAVLYISVLHCIPDKDRPAELVRDVMSRMAPGSFLAISHLVSDLPEIRWRITGLMAESTGGDWGQVRTADDIAGYFRGLEPVPPGIGEVTRWRPDDTPPVEQTQDLWEWGGVARKPPTA